MPTCFYSSTIFSCWNFLLHVLSPPSQKLMGIPSAPWCKPLISMATQQCGGRGGCSSGTDTECACQTHSCLAILRKLKIRLKRGLKSLVSLLKFKRKLCRKTRALLFVLLLPCLFCLQNWATYQRRNCSWQTVILRNCRVHWGDRGWRVARNWAADPHPVPLPSAMESSARI